MNVVTIQLSDSSFSKKIEPSLYPKLFQKNLDPDVFNQIIKILHDFYIE